MSHHSLQKLEEEVSTQILASSSIPSFHNVVEELVLNAVDASSTRIEIYVDMNHYSITVVDNGKSSFYFPIDIFILQSSIVY